MARLSAVNKSKFKIEASKKYYAYRAELRKKSVDQKLTDEERQEAQLKLQKLPRYTAHVQINRRCHLTGRAKGNLRKFGLCRNKFRELALTGKLPGVTKASW